MTSKRIDIHPGFKAFVAGIVNADFKQRAIVEINEADGGKQAVTFEGQGQRNNMKDTSDESKTSKDFGPYNKAATLTITIKHQRAGGGAWIESKLVEPPTIEKKPVGKYNVYFYKSTIISEDGADNSHDDCTVTVVQYKVEA